MSKCIEWNLCKYFIFFLFILGIRLNDFGNESCFYSYYLFFISQTKNLNSIVIRTLAAQTIHSQNQTFTNKCFYFRFSVTEKFGFLLCCEFQIVTNKIKSIVQNISEYDFLNKKQVCLHKLFRSNVADWLHIKLSAKVLDRTINGTKIN